MRKYNNKQRQQAIYKMKAVVQYFNQEKRESCVFYADDMPYARFTYPNRMFGKYKVLKATRMYDPNTERHWYLFNKSKVIKIKKGY